jgi:molecular chaperone GrpE
MARADDGSSDKGFRVQDKRWWLRDDVDLDEADAQAAKKKPTFVEDLERQLAERDQLLAETRQAHKDSKAGLDEVRQRLERELDTRLEVQRARLAEPFMEVLDNLGRLVEAGQNSDSSSLIEGAQLVLRQLEDKLSGLGLETIEALGQPFDPLFMEALASAPVPAGQVGQVLLVIRPGYKMGERVVRPAGVQVGVAEGK